MTLHTWLLFVVAVFVMCGTPGPNMLHILTRSVRFGTRRTVAAMAGCLAAVVAMLSVSAAGVGAILVASPHLFDAIRYVGVAYLVVLGIQCWRGGDTPLDMGSDRIAPAVSTLALFRGGVVVGLSNPKALLFAAAFLPQFLDKTLPEGPQFAILVATFALIECGWYAVYAFGGRKLAVHLSRPSLAKLFDRVTGTIFIGFGVALFGARV